MAIEIKEQRQFEKAIEKARLVRPRVSAVKPGEYLVEGSRGNHYTVTFSKVQGRPMASCTCPAHTGNGMADGNYIPRVCYHIPASWGLHIFMMAMQKLKESMPVLSLQCPRCDDIFETVERTAFFCPKCLAEIEARKAN